MRREKPSSLLFPQLLLLWLRWFHGGSTVDESEENEERTVVVVFLVVLFVVVGAVFVFAVSFHDVCCLVVFFGLDCRCRSDGGRGSRWLFEAAASEVTFHNIPVRGVFRCGDLRVVSSPEIVVVSVGSG